MKLQSIRGMKDVLPESSPLWRYIEDTLANVVNTYGYQELRPPMVESLGLFKRSIGEVTDVVEKEMYNFEDKSGEEIAMRPEFTAGMVRSVIEHNLASRQKIKLWALGPAFRYERPQKGRYRQFHQFDVEAFGWDGPDVDAEMIAMTAAIWRIFKLEKFVKLEINTIGTAEERKAYRDALVDYFTPFFDQLDENSQVRLHKNPLRILDSKDEKTQAIVKNAPVFESYLGESSTAHFAQLRQLLDEMGIVYTVNPYLVRGLDYYSKTVFEWVTDKLGAQSTVCGGGRYDQLVEQMGGKPTPGIGFAMGIERFIELVQLSEFTLPEQQTFAYFILANEQALHRAMPLAEKLRAAGYKVITHLGGGSFKSQFKKADQSGAEFALIIGEDELATNEVAVKPLRNDNQPQFRVGADALLQKFEEM